jgi:hypothetical protein
VAATGFKTDGSWSTGDPLRSAPCKSRALEDLLSPVTATFSLTLPKVLRSGQVEAASSQIAHDESVVEPALDSSHPWPCH